MIDLALTGEIDTLLGWRCAFGLAGIQSLLGGLLVWLWVPKGTCSKGSGAQHWRRIRAVLTNRSAMAYILAYSAHMWELFGLRAWMVAFLDYARQLAPSADIVLSPTQVVALINIIGLPVSIGGNELCQRFGRRKTLTWIMMISFFLSLFMGFSAVLPYSMVVLLGLVYGVFVLGDSASLTAGAVQHAPVGAQQRLGAA